MLLTSKKISGQLMMILSMFIFFSCEDWIPEFPPEPGAPDTIESIQITLQQGETYTYTLYENGIPIEGGYTIETQANHAEISEIVVNTSEPYVQYVYQPIADFIGTDRVVLEECVSNGADCVQLNLIELEFTIE